MFVQGTERHVRDADSRRSWALAGSAALSPPSPLPGFPGDDRIVTTRQEVSPESLVPRSLTGSTFLGLAAVPRMDMVIVTRFEVPRAVIESPVFLLGIATLQQISTDRPFSYELYTRLEVPPEFITPRRQPFSAGGGIPTPSAYGTLLASTMELPGEFFLPRSWFTQASLAVTDVPHFDRIITTRQELARSIFEAPSYLYGPFYTGIIPFRSDMLVFTRLELPRGQYEAPMFMGSTFLGTPAPAGRVKRLLVMVGL